LAAYFLADPARSTLVPWDYFDVGSGRTDTKSDPDGETSPGIVRPSATADGRPAYQLTVTPTAHASDAARSDSVYLWNYPRAYDSYRGPSVTTWFHIHVYFPSPGYTPTSGNWNWLIVHHNDSGYKAFACSDEFANISFGVTTDSPVVIGGVGKHPRLKVRVMGGATCSPRTSWFDLGRLRPNHWYGLLYRVTWDPVAGRMDLWVDHRRRVRYRGPTLYTRPDGTTSRTQLDLVNYRLHAPWDSTIYFGRVKIGPTHGSVR
jgi:hypothetical protein